MLNPINPMRRDYVDRGTDWARSLDETNITTVFNYMYRPLRPFDDSQHLEPGYDTLQHNIASQLNSMYTEVLRDMSLELYSASVLVVYESTDPVGPGAKQPMVKLIDFGHAYVHDPGAMLDANFLNGLGMLLEQSARFPPLAPHRPAPAVTPQNVLDQRRRLLLPDSLGFGISLGSG